MLKAGILVKRIPQITRNLDKLSHAYYNLRNTQNAETARPFEKSFYFKKGSIQEVKWDALNDQKKGADIKQPFEEIPEIIDAQSRRNVDESSASLNRKLDRNLYLVIKDQDLVRFPEMVVGKEEFLHDTTDRLVKETIGDADVWRVGQAPVGNVEKTFFLKYHVLGDITADIKSKVDIMWLDKEECQKEMTLDYYNGVKDML